MWSNRKQKRPEEYSTNPNTIRARRRKARLSPYSKEVEQAKASDSKAVTRAWKQRTDTDAYKMSSEDERKIILENVEKEVMDRRRQKGLDAETKIDRFMNRTHTHGPPNPFDPVTRPSTPTVMQPVAPMHTGSVSRYGTSGPAMPYVMPSVEGRAATEAPFHPLGPPSHPVRHNQPHGLSFYHYPQEHESISPYSNMHAGIGHQQEVASNAAFAHEHLSKLEKDVKDLNDTLVVANATIAAQQERLESMSSRMVAFDNAVASLKKAEDAFLTQNKKVDAAIRGIERIASVAASVADEITGGRPNDRVVEGPNGVTDAYNSDTGGPSSGPEAEGSVSDHMSV